MNVGLIQNTYSGITNGKGALQSAKTNSDNAKFSELIERLQKQNDGRGTLSSSQIAQDGRLNGDYSTSFAGTFSGAKDKNALPVGAAANQANSNVKTKTIDKSENIKESKVLLFKDMIRRINMYV